jgi:DNA-binding beta-propeller fold protein YncE
MKISKITPILAVLGLSLGQALAAPVPLNNPTGLAVDSKGNLYVANPGISTHLHHYQDTGGQVLVYSPNLVQQTAKNISGPRINYPLNVALNSADQLYVFNAGDETIRVFNGKVEDQTKELNYQNTVVNVPGAYFSCLGFNPTTFALDGLGNIWISRLGPDSTVCVFSPDFTNIMTMPFPGEDVTAIAISPSGPNFLESSVGVGTRKYGPIGNMLIGHGAYRSKTWEAKALTIDKTEHAYIANAQGTVLVQDLNANAGAIFANLGYGPSAIAVDNARNRVYFASDQLNQIDVYNLQGVHLHTIH